MPRQPSVDRNTLFAVLCMSKDAILQNGKTAPPAATVWTELSQQLGHKMSAKALYTFVKCNRHNICSSLDIRDHESHPETVDNHLPSGYISPIQIDCQTFQLEVPFEEWVKFSPGKVYYKNKCSPSGKKQYTVLKPGSWTHIINDLMWKKVKHTCTLVFQNAKVYSSDTSNYIKIVGFCKECRGRLRITCDREPAINCPMVLQCSFNNIDVSLHTGRCKRFVSGNLREQIAKELCEGRTKPDVWRSAKAAELMDVGDPEPSHLPNLATLRKIKQKRNNLELGDKDPIASLQLLKYSTPHSGSIRDIGLDTFFCHYWSQTQLHVYNEFSSNSYPTVCFGVTGSVVKKLARPRGTSDHILLYQGVLTTSSCSSVPVVQMLSERHDINAITTWLTEWIGAGAAVPKEAMSDFSLDILGALVKAFTPHHDLKSYINECFHVLLGNQSARLPPCFVRVDVVHCIKMICQWDCLKNKTHHVKDFFVRSLAKLLQSQCLDHVKQLLHAIFVVALSVTEGDDSSGAPLASERCKTYLTGQIAEDSIIIPDEETEEMDQVDPCDEIQTDLQDWVINICEESRSLAEAYGDRDNIHFLPEIIPNIIRLSSYLPLWTGIMVPLFHSTSITASSATVEAAFKIIKHGLFKLENLPVHVDRFIAHHLSFIEGNVQICSAEEENNEATLGSATVTEADPATMTAHSDEGKMKMDAYPYMESDAATSIPPT